MMTTSNETKGKKLTKKDLLAVFWNSLALEYSWNYERQQNMGYCNTMMPVINKLYKGDKEKHRAAMERHMEFFNTTPYISTAIIGITAAMEESNSENEDFDTSAISSVKASMMSPLAGIGDSLFWELCVSLPQEWELLWLCRGIYWGQFYFFLFLMSRLLQPDIFV